MAIKLAQLSQRILKLSRNIEPNANEMTKAAARAFLNDIIDAAPVDTGQLVSSWKVGLNYHPKGTRIFVPGKLGSTAAANREAVRQVVLDRVNERVTGQTINIVNDTPYLMHVNDGAYEDYIDAALRSAMEAVRQRKIL